MAINNTVILIGNIADEAKIIDGENKQFAAIRIAVSVRATPYCFVADGEPSLLQPK